MVITRIMTDNTRTYQISRNCIDSRMQGLEFFTLESLIPSCELFVTLALCALGNLLFIISRRVFTVNFSVAQNVLSDRPKYF